MALVLGGPVSGAAAVAAENGVWVKAPVSGGTHSGQEEFGPKTASGTTLAAKGAERAGAEFLLKNWDKATFPNRIQSIRYHWEKHGKPFRESIDEYTRDAVEFFQKNKSSAVDIMAPGR